MLLTVLLLCACCTVLLLCACCTIVGILWQGSKVWLAGECRRVGLGSGREGGYNLIFMMVSKIILGKIVYV